MDHLGLEFAAVALVVWFVIGLYFAIGFGRICHNRDHPPASHGRFRNKRLGVDEPSAWGSDDWGWPSR